MSEFRKLIEAILLDARQVGNLYHSTTIGNCLSIIKDNELIANPKIISEQQQVLDLNSIGISTSRNKLFMYKGDIEIILDGDKLSNRYNIIPYNYFYDHDNSEMTHAEKRNAAETIIISNNYLKFAKANEYNYDEVFYNPFTISNIQDYIIGFMVSPSIFASSILTKYLQQILILSGKPLYNILNNKQIEIKDFYDYTQVAQSKGNFSKIHEFNNVKDILDSDELELYTQLSQNEQNQIIQEIEQKYNKPYNELEKSLSKIQLNKDFNYFLNKLFLTKDNYD